ncbi:hypothetical protein KHS38_12115 [Mucilaginibacter sp. Bleaf8]|uniref:hypothetical protein n=1 Tax=Mucilaginibacter sp. Bleaf8 TaxID=2834430 RepID=UPI001BCF8888|nr:hypothetical protein [Mucilaginibacter sp. Bleaf8]MBS7565150.1 hypothetical protein [Mucilaginibacter sp. Bleaf8]
MNKAVEEAWHIASEHLHPKVRSNDGHSVNIIATAINICRKFSKERWMATAEESYRIDMKLTARYLAEEASSRYVNHVLFTNGLRVIYEGEG